MGQKVHPLGFRLGITQPHLSQWYASKKYYSKYILEDHFLRTILPKQYAKAGFEKIEISRKIENHLEIVIRVQKPEVLIGKKGENLKKLLESIKKLILKYRASERQSKPKLFLEVYVIRCQTGASSIADFLVENLEKRIPYKIVFVLLKKHLKKIRQREKALRSSGANAVTMAAQPSDRTARTRMGPETISERSVNGTHPTTWEGSALGERSSGDSQIGSVLGAEGTSAQILADTAEKDSAAPGSLAASPPLGASGERPAPLQNPGLLEAEGMKILISGRLNGAEIARQEWIREGRLPLQTLQAKIDYSFKKAYTIYGILGVKVWVFKNIDNVTTKTYKI